MHSYVPVVKNEMEGLYEYVHIKHISDDKADV